MAGCIAVRPGDTTLAMGIDQKIEKQTPQWTERRVEFEENGKKNIDWILSLEDGKKNIEVVLRTNMDGCEDGLFMVDFNNYSPDEGLTRREFFQMFHKIIRRMVEERKGKLYLRSINSGFNKILGMFGATIESSNPERKYGELPLRIITREQLENACKKHEHASPETQEYD